MKAGKVDEANKFEKLMNDPDTKITMLNHRIDFANRIGGKEAKDSIKQAEKEIAIIRDDKRYQDTVTRTEKRHTESLDRLDRDYKNRIERQKELDKRALLKAKTDAENRMVDLKGRNRIALLTAEHRLKTLALKEKDLTYPEKEKIKHLYGVIKDIRKTMNDQEFTLDDFEKSTLQAQVLKLEDEVGKIGGDRTEAAATPKETVNVNGQDHEIQGTDTRSGLPYITIDGKNYLVGNKEKASQPDNPVTEAVPAPAAKSNVEPEPKPSSKRGSFTEGPTEENRELAEQEVINLASKLGVGPENWKALAKNVADFAGYAVEDFLFKPIAEVQDIVSNYFKSQGEMRERLYKGSAQ